MTAASARTVLLAAAAAAGRQPSVTKAVAAGWSALHASRALIGDVFAAWAREEQVSQISDLGEVCRRRYDTAEQVARSLTRAAYNDTRVALQGGTA